MFNCWNRWKFIACINFKYNSNKYVCIFLIIFLGGKEGGEVGKMAANSALKRIQRGVSAKNLILLRATFRSKWRKIIPPSVPQHPR